MQDGLSLTHEFRLFSETRILTEICVLYFSQRRWPGCAFRGLARSLADGGWEAGKRDGWLGGGQRIRRRYTPVHRLVEEKCQSRRAFDGKMIMKIFKIIFDSSSAFFFLNQSQNAYQSIFSKKVVWTSFQCRFIPQFVRIFPVLGHFA